MGQNSVKIPEKNMPKTNPSSNQPELPELFRRVRLVRGIITGQQRNRLARTVRGRGRDWCRWARRRMGWRRSGRGAPWGLTWRRRLPAPASASPPPPPADAWPSRDGSAMGLVNLLFLWWFSCCYSL